MCEEYRKRYKDTWGQEIDCPISSTCQVTESCDCKGCNILNLFRKITIPSNISSDAPTGNSETSNGEDQKLEHFKNEDNDDH